MWGDSNWKLKEFSKLDSKLHQSENSFKKSLCLSLCGQIKFPIRTK